MNGWISLNRELRQHWLWQDKPFTKGQAWIDLLLLAQHTESKIPVKDKLIELKRGDLLTQERTLVSSWGWSKTKVRSFLKLLENDSMIVRKIDHKKTIITICNYESYQDTETKKEPKKNQKKTKKEPKKDLYNNDNKENNVNNFKKWTLEQFKDSVRKVAKEKKYTNEMCLEFINHFTEENEKGVMLFQMKETWSTGGRLARWLSNKKQWSKNGK